MTQSQSQTSANQDREGIPYAALAMAIILAVTLFRFWYCTRLELVGDEAYYWNCSRHLDLSFFDKGPGAACTIALGTKLFGDTVLGVRFFAVVLSAATGLALFLLARMLFTARVAFWTVIAALVTPLFAVGSILMTIDPLSVFFWTAAALVFWKAKDSRSLLPWIATGALVGIGALAKYTNLMELLCFAIFCGWCAEYRRQFLRPHFYALLVATVVCILPIILWNKQHGWIAIGHLAHRGGLNSQWRLNPLELLSFLGQQAGVISPLFFLGIMLAVFWPKLSPPSVETRYLLSLFLPLFLLYVFISINKAGQPNWTAPAYVAGLILLVAKWPDIKRRFPWARSFGSIAIGLAVVETIALHNTDLLPFPPGRDPMDRLRGFQSIAQRADEIAKQQGAAFFITNKYTTASLLTFYMPGHPDTYLRSADEIENQYSIWPGYYDKFKDGPALLVSDAQNSGRKLEKDFSDVKLLEETYSTYKNRQIAKYYFYLCRGLRPAPPKP